MVINENQIPIETVFKGINKEEMRQVKSLIGTDDVTTASLEYAINSLPLDQQWTMDTYLEKAKRMQRISSYLKKSFFISLAMIAIALIILDMFYLL